jgi:phosphatidylserine/phosphatidylglycerophosphate/cardiolipin synthase-like enzyme
MNRPQQAIIEHARRLAAEMPPPLVEALAQAIDRAGPGWVQARGAILAGVPHPLYRALAGELIRTWEAEAPTVSPDAVALALLTAAEVERRHREGESVELVWTGPDAGAVPVRHTEQAILQVIDAAQDRLLLVSYAVYKVPRVCGALVRAADRGVRLRIVVEADDQAGSHSIRSKLIALGDAVARRAEVYYWPAELRPRNDTEGQGVLHVKAAVADGGWLLLTSANLTEYALALNMEMGLLLRGGVLPALIEQQFGRLIEIGQLRLV